MTPGDIIKEMLVISGLEPESEVKGYERIQMYRQRNRRWIEIPPGHQRTTDYEYATFLRIIVK